jgi:hypothetical protein
VHKVWNNRRFIRLGQPDYASNAVSALS